MNIGYTRNSYAEKRCIITSDKHNYFLQFFLNPLNYVRRIPVLKRKIKPFVFMPIYNPKIDLYHTFNDICITNKSWVVTFETMLPRFDLVDGYHRQYQPIYPYHKTVEFYLKKIASPNCLASIALSKSALKIQEKLLESYPELKQDILKKSKVIYPPQDKLTNEASIKNKSFEKLKLIFVGGDFYRKGGSEIVIAISELLSEKKITEGDVEVTLVGDIKNRFNYALQQYQDSQDYFDTIEKTISNHSNIKIIPRMDNSILLETIKNSHIGLLPTWADTFGYSVLEFQASGCPVISTNLRALPEINNSNIGWIIPINHNEFGEVVIDSHETKENIRRSIINGLKSAITECLNDRELIRHKAVNSLQRIEKEHCREKYNLKMQEIYNKAI